MEAMTELSSSTSTFSDLILSLEQSTRMAKQLPTNPDPTHLLQIYNSLHQTHLHLSTFLSRTTQFIHPLHPPPPPPAAENSLSSATGAAADENGDEPMEVGDDEEQEENSKGTIEKVEEKMRDCFIRCKRPKRTLSPSAAAGTEEGRVYDDGFGKGQMGFDPHAVKLRALDLVYQFHG